MSPPHNSPTTPSPADRDGSAAVASTPTGPVTPKERIHALDILRGFALCGIIFINIPQTMGMFHSAAALPDGLRWFVLGRFYPIFYTLFGIGFGLFLRSATRRTDRPRVLLLRRLLALAVMGGLLHLIQPGEVLLPFAVTGVVVLLPVSYLSGRVNLVLGVVLTLAGIAAGVGGLGLLPGLFALGFALADLDVPRTLGERTRQLVVLAAASISVSLLMVALVFAGLPDVAQIRIGTTLSLAMAFSYASVFLLLVLCTPLGRGLGFLLAPMGRMALTNYLSQAVLFVSFGTLLGLRGSSNWALAIGLGWCILAMQAIWSRAWLSRFTYGPMEWVWRCVTYWRTLPIRDGPSAPAGAA